MVDILIKTLLFYFHYVPEPWNDFDTSHGFPVHAISMAGTDALWNVALCIETVIAEKVPGDFVETGIWKGGSVILAESCWTQPATPLVSTPSDGCRHRCDLPSG